MDDFPISSSAIDELLEKEVAREVYERLRRKLVALKSAPEQNMVAIDTVVRDLEKAQLAFKAAHGMIGNNPIEDPQSDGV